jgi:hypothetical protein
MSKFKYTFISNYSFDTYDDVINTYEWLKRCLEYVFIDTNNLEFYSTFAFSANRIEYECSSINEFKENAFGMNIKPSEFYISASEKSVYYKEPLAYFWIGNISSEKKIEIILSSDYKDNLISLRDAVNLEYNVLIYLLTQETSNKAKEMQLVNNTTVTPNVSLEENQHINNKEHWYEKLLWQVLIPLMVMVIGAIIVWILKIN